MIPLKGVPTDQLEAELNKRLQDFERLLLQRIKELSDRITELEAS